MEDPVLTSLLDLAMVLVPIAFILTPRSLTIPKSRGVLPFSSLTMRPSAFSTCDAGDLGGQSPVCLLRSAFAR